MSEFPNEHYLAKNLLDGAIRQWRLRDLSWISFVTIPACDRRTDRQTDGHGYGYDYTALHNIS